MTDEERKQLALEVAKLIPTDAMVTIIGGAIQQALGNLRWGQDELTKIVHDAVVAKAKELLTTQYAPQVEAQAHLLAAQMVGELARMKLAAQSERR